MENQSTLLYPGENRAVDSIITTSYQDEEYILLVKRQDGTHAFPGGFVEKNKTGIQVAEETARRETLEETGFKLDQFEARCKGYYQKRDRDPRADEHRWVSTQVFHFNLGEVESLPKLVSGSEVKEAVWRKITQALNLQLYADHKQILQDFLRTRDAKDWRDTREIVIRHESWRYYWGFFALGIVFLALVIAVSLYNKVAAKYIGLILAVFWVFHLIIRSWLIYYCRYSITKDVLVIRRGFIFRSVMEVPITEITDISFNQSKKEKFLGVGSLYISTKTGDMDYLISGVSNPEDIRDHIWKVRFLAVEKQAKKSQESEESSKKE